MISKVDCPTPWCAGMVIVPKTEWIYAYLCESQAIEHQYPLPTADEILAQLMGARVVSKLNGNSGFLHIPKLLTTFINPYRCYCFNKLPFGNSSVPEHFQKQISQILAN